MRRCTIEGCTRPHVGKGLCSLHWQRAKRDGELPPDPELAERMWRRRKITADGCWVWTATLDAAGYGMTARGGRMLSTHRVAYELLIGPIPEGMEIDHLCFNRACFNPSHLEAVTRAENMRRRRGRNRRSHCQRGHAMEGENLYVSPAGKRRCKACQRLRDAAFSAGMSTAEYVKGL